jgi:hypothetical protein
MSASRSVAVAWLSVNDEPGADADNSSRSAVATGSKTSRPYLFRTEWRFTGCGRDQRLGVPVGAEKAHLPLTLVGGDRMGIGPSFLSITTLEARRPVM